MCGLMVLWAAGGAALLRRLWLPTLLLALAMAAGQYAGAVLGGVWNLGALAGSVVGLGVAFAASLIARRRRPQAGDSAAPDGKRLVVALSGYGVLLTVVLAFQFVPALGAALGGLRVGLVIPPLETSLGFVTPGGMGRELVLLRHIGAQLLYAAGIAYLIYAGAGRYTPGAPRRILGATLRGVISPSVSIVSMIALAQVMESSGMTYTLADTLAGGLGALFPLAAPLIGGLGAFVTGSNTNSNVIFGALQAETAHLLRFSIPVILAAQTAGGSLGSALAPAKLVVGASTVGLNGQEGRLLRQMLPYVLIQMLVLGGLTWLAARW
jgi:lactate permease